MPRIKPPRQKKWVPRRRPGRPRLAASTYFCEDHTGRGCKSCAALRARAYRQRNAKVVRARDRARNAVRRIVLTALTVLTRALRRGIVVPAPCEVCDTVPVVPHHDDPIQPLNVRWFCRSHRADHRAQRARRPVVKGYLATIELHPDTAERLQHILPTLTASEQEKIRQRASFLLGRRLDVTSPLYHQQLLRSFQTWETTQLALEAASEPLRTDAPAAKLPQVAPARHLSDEDLDSYIEDAFAKVDSYTSKVSAELDRYRTGGLDRPTTEGESST